LSKLGDALGASAAVFTRISKASNDSPAASAASSHPAPTPPTNIPTQGFSKLRTASASGIDAHGGQPFASLAYVSCCAPLLKSVYVMANVGNGGCETRHRIAGGRAAHKGFESVGVGAELIGLAGVLHRLVKRVPAVFHG
jgi:hypothetical protein